MKKAIIIFILALTCIMGYAQVIDPVLEKEMGQRKNDEKIDVFVIMKQQYYREQLSRRADYYTTRAARREFVVNELKQFTEASQYNIRQSLAKMEKNGMVTEPRVLWMANALYFSATKQAIFDLAKRKDVEVIGFDERMFMLPEEEKPRQVEGNRDITPNVIHVNANQVWDMGYTGQGVVVAVLDAGVKYDHLDFKGHLWDGGEAFPKHGWDIDGNDNDPMDYEGHGTHCAGTLCGDGGGGRQTGMAPDAILMCVKVLDDEGFGAITTSCAGIEFAAEHGADIFSMSLGWRNESVANRELARNTCSAALDAGMIGAIAAGNEGHRQDTYSIPNNVRLPGSCPPPYLDPVQQVNPGALSCVVCVGNIDYTNAPSPSTSQGPVSWSNTSFADYPYAAGSNTQFGLIRPDVCAPGVNIISADYRTISGYMLDSGTSMSTPCVAGCMALMLSKNPELTPADLCRILEETAVPLAGGKSNIFGFGCVDALAAVNAVPENVLSLASYTIHDNQGNNDQQLNADESVTMDLELRCGSNALNNAVLNITCGSEFVTITNGSLVLPDFEAGQTHSVTGFSFSVDEAAPVGQKLTFHAEVLVDGASVGHLAFALAVRGNDLVYEGASIVNDNNANGILEPGETADLRIFVNNFGNETAHSVTGTLTSASDYISINDVDVFIGDVGVHDCVYADFSVTLSANASNPFPIPCTLNLMGAESQANEFTFNLFTITATAEPEGAGTVTGIGTFGSGMEVRLSTIPNDNYAFMRWKIGNEFLSYTDFSISVSENANYVAEFGEVGHVVSVGQAAAARAYLPTCSYYNYNLTQQIYTAEEIGSACEITSVAFFNVGTSMTRRVRLYLKHTEKESFQDGYDWETITSGDLFFEGNVTFASCNWTTINFRRAFAYDGIHNLVLTVDDNTGSYTSGLQCRATIVDCSQALFIYSDNVNFNPYNTSETNSFCKHEKNQVLFGITSDKIEENATETETGSFCYVKDKLLFVNKASDKAQLNVIDVMGRTVKSVELTDNSCSVADLPAGIYVVRLSQAQGQTTQKIVIE